VVFEENDYWPLPWYLRSFEKINWLTSPEDITTAPDIVICSADLADGLSKRLYDIQTSGSRSLYIKLFEEKQYRPGKAFSVYLKQ
jgi:predicted membrane-bound mannosyltransferase